MEKRRVPKGLHEELSEYASLLRALRARDTSNLTRHVVEPSPFFLHHDEDSPCPGPSDLSHPANIHSKKESLNIQGKQEEVEQPLEQTRRDHWTRWPLPLKDVLLPEWSLQDEVAFIAAQVMDSRQFPEFPGPIASPDTPCLDVGDDDDPDRFINVIDRGVDSDDPEPLYYISYLTSVVSNYLATIFSILAALTPARPASMQNRIEPLNWRAVLDVVVSCGIPEFTNAKVVENVIKRMETRYGPSILPFEDSKATNFRAVERIRSKQAATHIFENIMENARDNYFVHLSSPLNQTPPLDPISMLKKRHLNKNAARDEEDYKARTKKAYTGPPRKRGNPNKKRPPKEPSSGQPFVGPGFGTEASQPTRRSSRIRSNVNYLEVPPDPLFKA